MAMTVRVGLAGHLSVARKLKAGGILTERLIKGVILDSSFAIMNDARTRCPVRKLGKIIGGLLRSSIDIEFYNNGFTGNIGTNVFYGPFVEFGTGARGALSVTRAPPAPYAHSGWPSGQRAQPYLYPAFDAEKDRFLRNLRNAVNEGMR